MTIIRLILLISLVFSTSVLARNPCSDAFASLLTGKSEEPIYSFISFNNHLLGKHITQDTFISVTDEQLNSIAFKKYLSFEPYSRIIFRSSSDEKNISKALNTWVKEPKIFFPIPNNKTELKNIYNKKTEDFYRKASLQMLKAKKQLNNIKLSILQNSTASKIKYSDFIIQYINESKDTSPIIIFAHNDNGILHFPDGSQLKIDYFSEIARKKGRYPVVISCNTYKNTNGNITTLITTSSIYYEDFSLALVHASKELSNKNCLYLGDYLKIFDNTFIEQSAKKRIKIKLLLSAIPASGTTVLIVAAFESSKKSNKKNS